jgi:TRAP-type C4-dicarboxylate transport system substrate-binding protein
MTFKLRHAAIMLAATAIAAALTGGAALAQDKPVELRFSHWVPPSHPMHAAAEAWAESIKKASNGTIAITIFPAQQLGKAFDHYNMTRDGIVDIGHINPGYEPGRFPVVGAMELPFQFANAKSGSAAVDDWYRQYAGKEMADVRYCLMFVHDPATIHMRTKKIVVPADMQGVRMRPANATISRFITLLGGTNIQASAPEARDVLAKGVADGITFPWGSVVLFGIDKAVKYHMDSPFYVTEQVWALNKAKYESMSAAQKKVMDDHCTPQWAQKIAEPWADFESDGRNKIKAQADHEIYSLTPDQVAQWRKAAEPLQAEWEADVKKAGYDPKAVLDALKKSLEKYSASY